MDMGLTRFEEYSARSGSLAEREDAPFQYEPDSSHGLVHQKDYLDQDFEREESNT
jgi:hypothetical protein